MICRSFKFDLKVCKALGLYITESQFKEAYCDISNLKENKDSKYFLDKKHYLNDESKEKWQKIVYVYIDIEESKRIM